MKECIIPSSGRFTPAASLAALVFLAAIDLPTPP